MNEQSVLSQKLDSAGCEEQWLRQLSDKVLLFYIRPLLSKWLKAFKAPKALLVSDASVSQQALEKGLNVSSMAWMTHEEADQYVLTHTSEFDLLVVVQESLALEVITSILPLLKRGGALVLVTRNPGSQWQRFQNSLESEAITDLFPVGFHPKGAVAWWPFQSGFLLWLGKLIDGIVPFFPGRYPMGLRWGQAWVIRGLKRDDRTILT